MIGKCFGLAGAAYSYRNSLLAAWSRDQVPVWTRFSVPNPASCKMGQGRSFNHPPSSSAKVKE